MAAAAIFNFEKNVNNSGMNKDISIVGMRELGHLRQH